MAVRLVVVEMHLVNAIGQTLGAARLLDHAAAVGVASTGWAMVLHEVVVHGLVVWIGVLCTFVGA